MKNYLIVGGSSGIGKALCHALSSAGHHIYATYLNTEVDETMNGGVEYHRLDVKEGKPDLDFLPEVLDGIAYCPGSINLAPFHRIKAEAFREDFDLQVVGAVKVIQAALPNLKASEQASILLFSTVAVQTGFQFHAQVSASKGALEGLTRALAAELAPKVRVNAIAPSVTDTPLASRLLSSDDKKKANADRHPLKTIGSPEDMASMGTFLLSDASKWVTGQIIHVDGGMSSIRL